MPVLYNNFPVPYFLKKNVSNHEGSVGYIGELIRRFHCTEDLAFSIILLSYLVKAELPYYLVPLLDTGHQGGLRGAGDLLDPGPLVDQQRLEPVVEPGEEPQPQQPHGDRTGVHGYQEMLRKCWS